MRIARHAMAAGVHVVDDDAVLDTASSTGLTAYDAEFVALARALGAPLVTADKAVLKACPDVALPMEGFVRAT
jgi:predicted nucleic acid-binding protein